VFGIAEVHSELIMVSEARCRTLPPDENKVVEAFCEFLREEGFEVSQALTTKQQGIDVVAKHLTSGVRLLAEVKGGTSSRKNSPRVGHAYTPEQVLNRVAKGVFTCLQLRSQYPDATSTRVMLAVPSDPHSFGTYLDSVSNILKSAAIEIWFAPPTKDHG
jgi:hypothetical protein